MTQQIWDLIRRKENSKKATTMLKSLGFAKSYLKISNWSRLSAGEKKAITNWYNKNKSTGGWYGDTPGHVKAGKKGAETRQKNQHIKELEKMDSTPTPRSKPKPEKKTVTKKPPLNYKPSYFKILKGADTGNKNTTYLYKSKDGNITASFSNNPHDVTLRATVGDYGKLQIKYPYGGRLIPNADKLILEALIERLNKGEYNGESEGDSSKIIPEYSGIDDTIDPKQEEAEAERMKREAAGEHNKNDIFEDYVDREGARHDEVHGYGKEAVDGTSDILQKQEKAFKDLLAEAIFKDVITDDDAHKTDEVYSEWMRNFNKDPEKATKELQELIKGREKETTGTKTPEKEQEIIGRSATVIEATNLLLSVCDGAKEKDGMGYNKPDSDFVRAITRQGFPPTPSQLTALHDLLLKYKKQLEGWGIAYQLIPVPPKKEEGDIGKEVAERMHITAKNYKIHFGKYSGNTLEQIAITDIQYLSWLAGTDGDTAELVKLALNGEPLPPQQQPDTTTRLGLEGNTITINTPIELKDVCKSLSNRKWNPDKKRWEAPKGIIDEVMTAFAEYNPTISAELQAEIDNLNTIKAMATASKGKIDIRLKNGLKLLPFQTAGVEFIDAVDGNAMVSDEMGLGKTVQALAYTEVKPELRPVIIICPASLKLNWEREARKWLNDNETISVIEKKMESASIVIINYDIVGKFLEQLKNLKAQLLIMDESHYVKNYKAKRTKYIQELSQTIPHRILLSGTPIMNRPCEIWTQLNIINPVEWDNFFKFGERYCNAKKTRFGWDFNGSSHAMELHERLKTISIRRKKADVLSELPAKRRAMIPIKISNIKEYHKAEQDTIAFIREKKGAAKADSANRAEILARIELLKQVAVEGKMDGITDWIDTFIETGEKLVVFASHHFVINTLYDKYKNIAVKLTGETSQDARQKAVDDFQNNPNIKLFIGNLQAAGVGITLTASSNVAIIELGWNPAIMSQAEDRVHRIGQKNAINVNYLLARNTIDETIAQLLEEKSANIDAAMDGREAAEYTVLDKLIEGM